VRVHSPQGHYRRAAAARRQAKAFLERPIFGIKRPFSNRRFRPKSRDALSRRERIQLSLATIATYNMTTEVVTRRATAGDAEAVYEIVLRALRETNARDYPASVIDRLVLTLPKGVASKLEEWHAYVAVVDGRIVGTASLNDRTVRAVFVHPDYQGRGIGTELMNSVENAASVQSESTLSVQSSITAQPFYAKRGFKVVREVFYGEERTIVMSKDISSPSE